MELTTNPYICWLKGSESSDVDFMFKILSIHINGNFNAFPFIWLPIFEYNKDLLDTQLNLIHNLYLMTLVGENNYHEDVESINEDDICDLVAKW